MKTHNGIIYHCLSCGSVVHADQQAQPPQCCGHQMVRAAAETINEEKEQAGEAATGHCESDPPFPTARKPR